MDHGSSRALKKLKTTMMRMTTTIWIVEAGGAKKSTRRLGNLESTSGSWSGNDSTSSLSHTTGSLGVITSYYLDSYYLVLSKPFRRATPRTDISHVTVPHFGMREARRLPCVRLIWVALIVLKRELWPSFDSPFLLLWLTVLILNGLQHS